MRIGEWSETEHIDHYLTLIAQTRGARDRSPFPRPHSLERRAPISRTLIGWQWPTAGIDEIRSAGINRPHGMI